MATSRFHDDVPDVDGLYADLAAADLQPLWVQPDLLSRTALEALGLARTEEAQQQDVRADDA